jgi:tetratricopeptide (TPR) repeat protein
MIEELINQVDQFSVICGRTNTLLFAANAQRHIRNNAIALELFKSIIQIDEDNSYAYRQIAWIHHEFQDWEEARESAVLSHNYDNQNPKHIIQVAKILTLNKVKYFYEARQYYLAAVKASNQEQYYIDKLGQYDEACAMLEYMSGIEEEELIPHFVADEFRPGIKFYRNYYQRESV